MLKTGVTGGIGSGKSVISRVFSTLGVPVYNADEQAKKLVNEKNELQEAIGKEFGDEVWSGGKLNRKRLASVVFNDPDALARLNEIVHPAVARHFKHWTEQHTASPYIIKESAILFESFTYRELDYVMLVVAPEEIRIKRVMERDDTDAGSVRLRMINQWPDEKKNPLADKILLNDGNNPLLEVLLGLHEKFSKGEKPQGD